MTIKRTISGMEAVDRAEYWLKYCNGDEDEAKECVRSSVRGRRRQTTIIAAIDFIERSKQRPLGLS